jgi:hypothetical protein
MYEDDPVDAPLERIVGQIDEHAVQVVDHHQRTQQPENPNRFFTHISLSSKNQN